MISDRRLRWHVFWCRRKSDTKSRFLLELARTVARAPRVPDPPPLLEIGTRSGGSALLMLRGFNDVYPRGTPHPPLLTVDPHGPRPCEGASSLYDERDHRAVKRKLAPHADHIHYMHGS